MPYRGGRTHLEAEQDKEVDIEAVEEVEEEVPIVSEDTPFFHFDLPAAVRAAEAGLSRRGDSSETSSLRKPQMSVSTDRSGSTV